MSEASSPLPKSRNRLPWVIGAVVLGLCALAGACAVGLALFAPGVLSGRETSQRIPSPDRSKVLVTSLNADQTDPRSYLTVQFEIRDAQSDTVLFRESTGASDRMRWSMQWLSDDEVQLISSDIGDYCWRESAAGEWTSAPCSR